MKDELLAQKFLYYITFSMKRIIGISMSWFCYVVPGRRTMSYESQHFAEYTGSMLEEMLNVGPGNKLFIQTPLYCEAVASDSKPLQKFPGLLVPQKITDFKRPQCFLYSRPDTDSAVISILVRASCNSSVKIPPFYVDFDMSEFAKKPSSALSEKIIAAFGMPTLSASVTFLDDPIEDGKSAKDTILRGKTTGFDLNAELTPKALAELRQRTFIVAEIMSTEESYIHDLSILLEVWHPGLSENGLMQEEDLNVLFKDIHAILIAQRVFLDRLRSGGSEYAAQVASTFLEFTPAFKNSQQYVANYPSIVGVVNKYNANKRWRKKTLELQEAVDGRDFQSYLITPVQRLPRYTLFLRDLIKHTPKSHPDAELLTHAFAAVEGVTKLFDETTGAARSQAVLNDLQLSIRNGFTFLDVQRELLAQWCVTVKRRTVKRGVLYLFNDLVMLTKPDKNDKTGVNVICHSGVNVFTYKNLSDDSFSVVDNSKKKTVTTIKFDEASEKQTMLSKVGVLQDEAKEKSRSEFTVKWISGDLCPLVKPRAVSMNNWIYVFSGEGQTDCFSLSGSSLSKLTTLANNLRHLAVTASDKAIYLWSVDSLYAYDPMSDDLRQIRLTQKIRPRRGTSIAFYNQMIVLVGGKSTTSREYFKDAFLIDLDSGSVREIDSVISPRWQHAVCVLDGKLFLSGGSNGTDLHHDMYSLNLSNVTWDLITQDLEPRKRHSMIPFGTKIMITGGSEPSTVIIDSKIGMISPVEHFGNVDTSRYSSAVLSSKNNLWIVTGAHDKKTTHGGVYKIEIPDSLMKRAHERKARRYQTEEYIEYIDPIIPGICDYSAQSQTKLPAPYVDHSIYPRRGYFYTSDIPSVSTVDDAPLLENYDEVAQEQESGFTCASYLKLLMPLILVGSFIVIACTIYNVRSKH